MSVAFLSYIPRWCSYDSFFAEESSLRHIAPKEELPARPSAEEDSAKYLDNAACAVYP
jgi:hypothetical protein